MAHAQQLQVDAAQLTDVGVVGSALSVSILSLAVGDAGVGHINIHVVEEVVLHEVAVALVVIARQALVLVQVHGTDVGKGQVALVVPLDQLLIGADGGGTGGQTQHAIGLDDDLRRDEIRGLTAHSRVVSAGNKSHN